MNSYVDSALSEMASDPPKEAVPVAELSAPESTGLVVGLTLATEQLGRCAAFYAKLLGRDIPVVDGIAEISPWLSLRQSEPSSGRESRLVINVKVENLAAARSRLGAGDLDANGRVLRTRDPGSYSPGVGGVSRPLTRVVAG